MRDQLQAVGGRQHRSGKCRRTPAGDDDIVAADECRQLCLSEVARLRRHRHLAQGAQPLLLFVREELVE